MKKIQVIVMMFVLFSCIFPPASAETDGHYSYINVKSVTLELSKNQAVYNLNYTIDEGVQFLVLFLGKSDLKNKLCRLMSIENCKFESVEMDHAVMVVDNPSLDNGDGSLWFPRKNLLTTIPEIYVKTPRTERNFSNTKEIPGMGYFSEPLPK